MAQAVAWHARERGVACRVVVPETAPDTKLDAVTRLGGELVQVSAETWFDVFRSREYPGIDGHFVHAFSDPAVIAGNGTIGLEIAEDLPDVDSVIVPYGGGGLVSGIAAALSVVAPRCEVYACEVETAAPLAPSALPRGRARTIRISQGRSGFARIDGENIGARDAVLLADAGPAHAPPRRRPLPLLRGRSCGSRPRLGARAGRMLRSPTVFEDVVKTT
jgi:cysteine synthase